ncbi:MAG TPA: sugar transferase [Candidatus Aquilonibacter sp.]|nr:sugar transferase [Candidatus Aquilonibacter sp.]
MTTKSNVAILETKPASRRSRGQARIIHRPAIHPSDSMQRILPEGLFLGMLCLERKRAERSRKKFLLLLLDAEDATKVRRKDEILKGVVRAADAARRDTDPAGWYKQDAILGIIFTELGSIDDAATINKLLDKVHESLELQLPPEDCQRVHVSIHVFDDDTDGQGTSVSVNPAFYPDILHKHDSKKVAQFLKRAMDIFGSMAALILFAPVFVAIAAIVKITSKGPVFFKQERLGRFGETFQCLKFRSMYVNNDLKIHQQFIKGVIKGSYDGGKDETGAAPVYKMKDDPRVTRVGKFIRRTSLDELPQFINVLLGEMSLVGPRPPLAYEYEEYDIWHRRRVLEVKPGITGLWQVNGRSRVRFDDMVRLDLQYARSWSLWLDVQILAQTPRAVVLGDGAY